MAALRLRPPSAVGLPLRGCYDALRAKISLRKIKIMNKNRLKSSKVIMTLLLMGVTAVFGGDVAVSFARGGWKEADWTMVKCGRWPNIGAWVQRDDHIENRIPADATKDEMLGQRAPETYTSMVWKTPVTTSFTVRSTMSFDYLMAPLIVLANELGKDANGYPEYQEHWEIVLWNEGINVWHHQRSKEGKPMWHRAAQLKKTFEKDKKYELTVSVDYTAKGPQVTIMCDGACFSYLEHDLPKKLYVGVTG